MLRLWPGAYSPAILTGGDSTVIRHTNHDLFLIDHFVRSSAVEFDSAQHGRVYSTSALELAKLYPFLMHGMIALSACHVQHLGVVDARKYRNAEAFHCHLASQGLRNAVGGIIASTNEADSILTTAMLLNTLTFCAASYRDDESAAPHTPGTIARGDRGGSGDGGRRPRFDWLRIQIGLTDLLMRTQPYRADSIWRDVFSAANDRWILGPAVNNLGDRLSDFCLNRNTAGSTRPTGRSDDGADEALSADTETGDNVYAQVISQLTHVVERDPRPEYLLLYLQPVGAMTSEFVELLEANDVRALLLFAHWLRLLCCVDAWWCVRRTRRECRAICEILCKTLHGEDLDLLRLPAAACGFWQRHGVEGQEEGGNLGILGRSGETLEIVGEATG
ncbi:hypothetical protein BU24DRAFT_459867 [Aaosphaeria arxii CBS 175.79]|uniref:Uncharacterized protein n=1 Tax=Aaosphaeria arxii CBS 175.79 TaxID=1450172 RepID=A0A6A5Y656_9PLEO|nr:uncharacterized protein BU24DRAFT_459867 [Aaosphaeria arxii CBS 175.79]KAF2020270.1 hypothetical protein BU24DRAFT_459867 [Aaosphaeria arxii CBS 175.79]